jgi:hypothetical protein
MKVRDGLKSEVVRLVILCFVLMAPLGFLVPTQKAAVPPPSQGVAA